MKLTNVAELKERLRKEIEKQDGYFTKANLSMFLDCLKEYSEENEIEVICCKDCSHYYWYDNWDRDLQEAFRDYECDILHKNFGPDGFCCLAESVKNNTNIIATVVRCKDCKNARESEYALDFDGKTPLYECDYSTMENRGYEYCSWGERRE